MIGYNYIKLYIGSGNVNVWQGDKNEKRSNNNKVNEKFKYHGLKYLFTRNLNVTVSFALRRRDMRIAFSVSAVVVDGVFLAHPSEPTPLGGVKVTELRLVPPPLALRVAELGVHRSLAPVDVKPLVRCYEGCFRPIRFLQTTPRCPVISVPQTVVDLHWLVEWEFHSQVLAVLEHPDWHLVHKEHNLIQVPENGVSVVFFRGIKPEIDSLLSITLASGEHICLQNVRLSCSVPQELKVYLIMLRVLGR